MSDPSAIGIMEGAFFVSKRELLNWLRQDFGITISKIEECGSGVVYLRIMDKLFPGKVPLKKIKQNAKQEWECLHNLKVLQAVFLDCEIKKIIDIERLAKCMYIDNLEFLQWVKCFHDRALGVAEGPSSPNASLTHHDSSSTLHVGSKPPSRPASSISRTGSGLAIKSSKQDTRPTTTSGRALVSPNRIVSGSRGLRKDDIAELSKLRDQLNEKTLEVQKLKAELETAEHECHFYFGKLRQLEVLSEQEGRTHFTVEEVQDILFTEEDVSDTLEADAALVKSTDAV